MRPRLVVPKGSGADARAPARPASSACGRGRARLDIAEVSRNLEGVGEIGQRVTSAKDYAASVASYFAARFSRQRGAGVATRTPGRGGRSSSPLLGLLGLAPRASVQGARVVTHPRLCVEFSCRQRPGLLPPKRHPQAHGGCDRLAARAGHHTARRRESAFAGGVDGSYGWLERRTGMPRLTRALVRRAPCSSR